MLTTSDKQNIVDEVFDFDLMIHLFNGHEVYEAENPETKEKYLVFDSEDGEQVKVEDATEYIRLVYSKKIRDDVVKYLPSLMKSRRILNPDVITEDTPQCRQAIRRARSSAGKQTTMDKEYIVQNIKSQHQAQYTLAVLQIVTWATMRNHVFYFKGKNMMTDFEIEIPSDYWNAEIEELNADPLEALLEVDNLRQKFERNPKNPLEIQIGILTAITNEYDKFTNTVMPVIGSVVASMTIPTDEDLGDIDDAGLFRNECRRYLPELLRESDTNE